ncbi:protein YhfH [Bacillus sp. V5-8f]|nr:protein YhfH [Bacillus sp. V5-8f]PLT33808.1 YhfH family protein [Bacillus sp. V5-8f]
MIQSSVEFFRNLPAKQCAKCGEKIEEQHECYGSTCNHCINVSLS